MRLQSLAKWREECRTKNGEEMRQSLEAQDDVIKQQSEKIAKMEARLEVRACEPPSDELRSTFLDYE